jgi:hypothetical protein
MRRALLLLLASSAAAQQAPVLVIDAALHHLGNDRTPEWPEASAEPEGVKLELRFPGRDTGREQVLVVRHAHVDGRWTLLVNREPVGELLRGEASRETLLAVPAGLIRDGENELALVPEAVSDDIVVGDVRLHAVPLRELLNLRPARVTVADPDGRPLPARVTLTDEAGARVPVWYATRELTAVRDGLVYTADGRVDVELPAGRYQVHATRGAEWSLASAPLVLGEGDAPTVPLVLRREVDSAGWIAVDTHLHTVTFSGHGDATLTERVVTLAGEGVELAVATDHNHLTDYGPEQARLQLSGWYTAVTGDEVTTENGHFNAFPLDPAGRVPDWTSTDWVQLVDGMRAAGASVVVLNHPRWPDRDKGPFGVFGLDHATGARLGDVPFRFDAMEVMNATNEHEDPELLLADWFALLNRGEHVMAAGSSDSHTVGDPVGQGRTYARSASDDPAHLDVPALCEALRTGHSIVSLGLFADARVAGRWGPGDVAEPPGATVPLELRVAAPSWIHPREARVFVDGVLAATAPVPDGEGRPVDARLHLDVPLAARDDAWLACVVLGDGVQGAWWPTMNPYTFAATNPVWLDVDGDGHYTAPRASAAARLAELRAAGPQAARPADTAVLMHMLDLLGAEARGPLGDALLAAATPESRERAQAFLDSRQQ